MNSVIAIDPGDHIGTVYTLEDGIHGRTLYGDNRNAQLWNLLNDLKPSTIIYETFALRASAASKLVGNKFLTCEVIGVIKLYSQLNNVALVPQLPSTKEYCGFTRSPKNDIYSTVKIDDDKISEHVRDALRLYTYYKLFGSRFK